MVTHEISQVLIENKFKELKVFVNLLFKNISKPGSLLAASHASIRIGLLSVCQSAAPIFPE